MFWGKQTWIKILALSPTSKVVCRPHFISVLVHPVFYNRIAHIVWLIGNWDSPYMVPETEKFKIKVLVDSMSNEIWFPDSQVPSCYCVSTGRRRKKTLQGSFIMMAILTVRAMFSWPHHLLKFSALATTTLVTRFSHMDFGVQIFRPYHWDHTFSSKKLCDTNMVLLTRIKTLAQVSHTPPPYIKAYWCLNKSFL